MSNFNQEAGVLNSGTRWAKRNWPGIASIAAIIASLYVVRREMNEQSALDGAVTQFARKASNDYRPHWKRVADANEIKPAQEAAENHESEPALALILLIFALLVYGANQWIQYGQKVREMNAQ